jgi:hypothetical protein
MSLVLQMRNERAGLVAQVQALAQIEAGGGSLSAEQLQQFTSLESQINDLTAKISRAESAERLAAASAVPVNESAQGATSPPRGSVSGPTRQRFRPVQRKSQAWYRHGADGAFAGLCPWEPADGRSNGEGWRFPR